MHQGWLLSSTFARTKLCTQAHPSTSPPTHPHAMHRLSTFTNLQVRIFSLLPVFCPVPTSQKVLLMESGSRVPSNSDQAWDRQMSSKFAVTYALLLLGKPGAQSCFMVIWSFRRGEYPSQPHPHPPTHTGLHSSKLSQNLFRCKTYTVLSGKLQGCGREINKGSDSSRG